MAPLTAKENAAGLAFFRLCAKTRQTDTFLLVENFDQHATVVIEALRCTGGAGETTNAARDWVMEVAFRDRTD